MSLDEKPETYELLKQQLENYIKITNEGVFSTTKLDY